MCLELILSTRDRHTGTLEVVMLGALCLPSICAYTQKRGGSRGTLLPVIYGG